MNELKNFLNKEVTIRTKNDFFYRGKLFSLLEEGLVLIDRFDGEMFLALSEILSINKIRDE